MRAAAFAACVAALVLGSVAHAQTEPAPPSPSENPPRDDSVADIFATLARSRAGADDGWILTAELGGSVLTPLVERDDGSLAIAYGVRAGYRANDWSVVLVVEHDMWRAPELGGRALQHVLDVGVGVERYYVSGFLRTMLVVGASVLLRPNELDPRGSTGIFVDLRPIGIHWKVTPRASLLVDFLHLAFVAPVLSGVPLADIQFRSTVGLEVRLGQD